MSSTLVPFNTAFEPFASSDGSTILSGATITDIDYDSSDTVGNVTYYYLTFTFSGSPSLASVLVGYTLECSGASNSVNNGRFEITAVDDGADTVTVKTTTATSAANDETGLSATGNIYDDGARNNPLSVAKNAQGALAGESIADGHYNYNLNELGNLVNQIYQRINDPNFQIGPAIVDGTGATLADNNIVTSLVLTDADFIRNDSVDGKSYGVIEYSFSGSPDLSSVAAGQILVASGCSNASNNGSFPIESVDDGADTIRAYSRDRDNADDDETGLSASGRVHDGRKLVNLAGQKLKTFSAAEDWSVASGLSGTNIAEIRIVTSSFTKGEIHIDIDGSTDTTLNPSGSFDNFITGITSSIDINCVHTYDDFSASNGYDDTYDYSAQATGEASSVWVNPAGTRLYIGNGTTVYQYTMSPRDDLDGTVTYVGSHDFGAGNYFGFCLDSTEDNFYVLNDDDRIYEFPMSTAADISTVGSSTGNFDTGLTLSASDICLVDDTDFFVCDGNTIKRITMSTASDISTASDNGTYNTTSDSIGSNPSGIAVTDDGMKLYLLDKTTENIYELDFGTAKTPSTLSYNSEFISASSLSSHGNFAAVPGLCISGDSNNRYLYHNDSSDDVYKWDRREDFSGTVTARVLYGADG